MTATASGVKPATDATAPSPKVPIDFEVFDEKCAERNALDETARAELAGVNRVTLWRWRKGIQQPSLPVVSQIARTLDVSVDKLTGRPA